tara:strand:+ start:804 stop:1013 length:210 start_codon:yes stop_codon:yes gene_type:complete
MPSGSLEATSTASTRKNALALAVYMLVFWKEENFTLTTPSNSSSQPLLNVLNGHNLVRSAGDPLLLVID